MLCSTIPLPQLAREGLVGHAVLGVPVKREINCFHRDLSAIRAHYISKIHREYKFSRIWLVSPLLNERSQPMVNCQRNGPSIYDHYCSDMMKTSRQVIALNTTLALPPHPPTPTTFLILSD